MNIKQRVILTSLISSSLVLASCGTLLYPERQGQQTGRIDPAVAIMNGVGLLLFVIPGLVAYAIDFHTGAIYLPGGFAEADDIQKEDLKPVGKLTRFTQEEVAAVIEKELGQHQDLDDKNIIVIDLNSKERVDSYESLAQLKAVYGAPHIVHEG